MNICWQHPATPCNTLQHTATHCNTLQHTATHCNTLQHIATLAFDDIGTIGEWTKIYTYLYNALPQIATHCNTLQHTASYCNTLQHTASYCNTLQQPAKHTFDDVGTIGECIKGGPEPLKKESHEFLSSKRDDRFSNSFFWNGTKNMSKFVFRTCFRMIISGRARGHCESSRRSARR